MVQQEINSIVLAAGCFWGVQSALDELHGVKTTVVGYTGGHTKDPNYEQVCSGISGHAEAVEVSYNKNETSLEKVLEAFFKLHDPTTLNRQGMDIGQQYRSEIFYSDAEELPIIEKAIEQAQKKVSGRIVTKTTKLTTFFRAEEYHQKYFQKQQKTSKTL